MSAGMRRARLIVAVFPMFATAIQTSSAAEPTGAWRGSYVCGQGPTALDLVVFRDSSRSLRAEFHFGPVASNPGVPEGCYTMKGSFDAATGVVRLTPRRWLVHPYGYVMIGLRGTVRADGSAIDGVISPSMPGCTAFSVESVSLPPEAPAACHVGAVGVSVVAPASR